MELKLKSGLEDELIYLPFEKRNVVGKFIDKALYPYMYSKYPNLFDVIEDKKTIVIDDKPISNTISGSNSNIEGKIA
jgi:hypothetical protein